MPIVLNGPVNKNKLDKKVVEAEEDFTDLYLGGRMWKDLNSKNLPSDYSPFSSKEYYEYSF